MLFYEYLRVGTQQMMELNPGYKHVQIIKSHKGCTILSIILPRSSLWAFFNSQRLCKGCWITYSRLLKEAWHQHMTELKLNCFVSLKSHFKAIGIIPVKRTPNYLNKEKQFCSVLAIFPQLINCIHIYFSTFFLCSEGPFLRLLNL